MATALSESVQLPVPVLQYPHWRVHYEPDHYQEDRIPSLARCVELVEQTKVSLRGWDFPHLSDEEKRAYASNYVASWANFMGTIEYWRLYQSGQFIHLHAVEEVQNEYRKSLEKAAASHIGHLKIDLAAIPGYFSFTNFLYRIIEIFEFAARLSEKGVYENELTITIQLKHVRGFVLMADENRSWSQIRAADTDDLGRSWSLAVPALIADRSELALNVAVWFFERFHWLNPPLEVLRREQQSFLRGLV